MDDVQNMATAQSMCRFEGVYKSFDAKNKSIPVLHDINLSIPVGSLTILYGPSGSGKTTILNTLIGLEPVSAGKVTIDGIDLYSLSADKRANLRAKILGMVHQNNYWVNSLSVVENVAMPLLLAGWHKKKAMLVARASLERVGLQSYADYNPTVLSGGQQQRVSFARATVVRPKLLVADEPTGNLDSVNGDKIIELLQAFNESYNATVVLVTHNAELLKISDNIIHVKDGRIVEVETHPHKHHKTQLANVLSASEVTE